MASSTTRPPGGCRGPRPFVDRGAARAMGTVRRTARRRSLRIAVPLALASLVAAAIAVLGGGGAASAAGGGGTAKPPPGPVVAPFPVATLPDPAFTVDPKLIHGFDITGFLQDATVGNGDCPDVTDRHRFGGTAKIDGISYVIPCNLVVQMPANTLTWADMVDGGPSLALKDSPLASFEIRL